MWSACRSLVLFWYRYYWHWPHNTCRDGRIVLQCYMLNCWYAQLSAVTALGLKKCRLDEKYLFHKLQSNIDFQAYRNEIWWHVNIILSWPGARNRCGATGRCFNVVASQFWLWRNVRRCFTNMITLLYTQLYRLKVVKLCIAGRKSKMALRHCTPLLAEGLKIFFTLHKGQSFQCPHCDWGAVASNSLWL